MNAFGMYSHDPAGMLHGCDAAARDRTDIIEAAPAWADPADGPLAVREDRDRLGDFGGGLLRRPRVADDDVNGLADRKPIGLAPRFSRSTSSSSVPGAGGAKTGDYWWDLPGIETPLGLSCAGDFSSRQ